VTYRLPVTLFALALSAMAPALFAEDTKNESVQVNNTQHANLAPGGTLRIEHSYGDLTVEGWDRPEVEIGVVKWMPYDSKNKNGEASRHLERIRVGLESKSPSEVVVSTAIPSRGGPLMPPSLRKTTGNVTIEYLIYAPRDAKLVIHHGTGFVLVSDVKGDVDATCSRGDIVLMLRDPGPYSIDAKTRLGVVASDFTRIPQDAPHPATGPSLPRIHLRMGFGGITIKSVPVEGTSK
jgi:hypothetical protein